MQEAIRAEALIRQFGIIRAVNEVSFVVEPGEVFGMLGPNGAGKTTLVRLLNGVIEPDGGTARVLGFDPRTQGEDVRRQTGVLTETPALYERLSARDNLLFFGTLYGVPQADLPRRVDDLLERFGLADRANDRAGGYSKGMKQRLALARTLIHQPRLLFFDEPTAGLDPEAALQVTTLIQELSHRDGRTVFLCTHNLEEAQRLCDRVAVINQGRLLAVGTAEQLARGLWQGLWVDVSLLAPSDGLPERLRALPGVLDISADGLELAVQVAEEAAIPGLVAGLVAAGAPVKRVSPREHSLQEIYFKLQEEARS
ncbi:MAG: ABC transporter ATP-binding protein [Chloroflexi bacterium]|nr:ABC transporter ATP-binding protein [Chloroflexota bacterium]MDL1884847.1 ABC transporter ATP-binding protein [Anaerolineae bacterium CFX8]